MWSLKYCTNKTLSQGTSTTQVGKGDDIRKLKYDILHNFHTSVCYSAKGLHAVRRTVSAVKPMSKNLQSTLLTTSMSGKLILVWQNWEEKKPCQSCFY